MANLKSPESYHEKFDPDVYLDTYYSSVEGNEEEGELLPFFLDFFHDTFATGSLHGEKLLDIGTGPIVYSVISASPHVQEIHLSDFSDRNRQVLSKWLDGASNVPAIFEYFTKKENKGESVESRNKMMRQKVKKIYPIDLLQDKPIADLDCKYDFITTSLCIEAAARNKKEYGAILCKVSDMLNPGGHIVMVGVLGEEFYRVGDFKFPCLNIDSKMVKDSLKVAGFDVKQWRYMKNVNETDKDMKEYSDFDGLFAVIGKKW